MPDDALLCPECGALIRERKKGYRIAGGVLTIIASCLLFLIGFILMLGIQYGAWVAIVALLGIAGFAFGLAAGILALARRGYAPAIIGMGLVMPIGILSCVPIPYSYSYWGGPYYLNLWPLGLPIFVLSFIGIIFTTAARQDFAPITPPPSSKKKVGKLTPKEIESKVYGYIKHHRGEIYVERCAKELRITEDEVVRAIESLVKKGKVEK